jgi:hypothetical protein
MEMEILSGILILVAIILGMMKHYQPMTSRNDETLPADDKSDLEKFIDDSFPGTVFGHWIV